MDKKIILATIGSLGDLHPFIAVGLELNKLGFDVVLAVPNSQVKKVRSVGLQAHGIMPDFEQINNQLGITQEKSALKAMSDVNFIIDKILLNNLAESTCAFDEISEGACAIISSILTFPAPIIAEKRSLPFISGVLQPMTLISAYGPPTSPDYWMLAGKNFDVFGRVWNRMWFAIIRVELKRRYARRIDEVRKAHGLQKLRRAPLIDVNLDPAMTLALYSPLLAGLQPDYPVNTIITGFPFFDSDSGLPETIDTGLEKFLSAGPPPLVFTLGSFAVYAPGSFYEDSIKIAENLRMRAVLLTGSGSKLQSSNRVHVQAYAPYSQLFTHAAAIIHHGGIGTTGQALKAGKPQLIIPHLGDQWDNGARIKKLGVGDVLAGKRFTVHSAQSVIATLIGDPSLQQRASEIGQKVTAENGAKTAALSIAKLLN